MVLFIYHLHTISLFFHLLPHPFICAFQYLFISFPYLYIFDVLLTESLNFYFVSHHSCLKNKEIQRKIEKGEFGIIFL